jgi:hypothetical protein
VLSKLHYTGARKTTTTHSSPVLCHTLSLHSSTDTSHQSHAIHQFSIKVSSRGNDTHLLPIFNTDRPRTLPPNHPTQTQPTHRTDNHERIPPKNEPTQNPTPRPQHLGLRPNHLPSSSIPPGQHQQRHYTTTIQSNDVKSTRRAPTPRLIIRTEFPATSTNHDESFTRVQPLSQQCTLDNFLVVITLLQRYHLLKDALHSFASSRI